MSLEELQLDAENGNAEAQLLLSRRYADGNGVGQDLAEAVKWCYKAADQGNAEAQSILGYGYQSIEALKKSAIAGDAAAQFNLGDCYEKGHRLLQNYEEAVKWYRKAADQGVADAQYFFGIIPLT